MKSNKETRMKLEEVAREMLLIFQKVSNAESHKEEILEFVEAKDRFNTLLANMAKQEITVHELLEGLSNGQKEITEVGKVIVSRDGDKGVLCVVFGDGEVWVMSEITGADKSRPEFPANPLN